ncbi:MAG TPA: MATE family efflux transporter [Syntrophales bacterium]|nr:MATE family efflux transporter [Syntrophales bacterium]HPI58509.1 MATE family efflux transporter [Syntrophales bacterium]HPN26228.1 MATE family efflux transporter [Syntrophales bacterium]HQM30657.1 MATE family efflux transporter [Syntrophales bacterium]
MKEERLHLGEGPVGPLLLKMSLPSIASLMVMAFYNLLDAFWLAKIGPDAVAALTISFPVQILFAAIGVGTGVGAASFASRMFGAGEEEKAQKSCGQAVFLSLTLGFLTILAGLFYTAPILRAFGATEEILPLCVTYMRTYVLIAPFLFFLMMANNLFRAGGNPKLSMVVVIITSILGSVLDPLLIFGWGPFPEMGIRGAAAAAVISYLLTSILSLYFLLTGHSHYRLRWAYTLPDVKMIGGIYRVGFPALVMNVGISIVMTIFNHVLAGFGPNALAALGLLFRINGLVIWVIFGIGHGVLPMVGFNYGACRFSRLRETVATGVRWAALFGGASCLIMEIFARPIISFMTDDPALVAVAVPAMRIYVLVQILAGPTIVWINMFNGLGKGFTAMFFLFIRDFLFLIPFLYLLPGLWGLNGVWASLPISNIIAFALIYIWSKRELGRLPADAAGS